ncbi:ketohydroxyglutarate aldolase [Blastococcus sp. CT_GayMR16]|uniref:ketohydroxyglutarate aldolase n=1 Tax=Blastococcus sp. CT_GayMR16 TaxID=2559607 RepID=UPI001073EE68|nr:ketohydroxyglutarate aldolase [Blastococcus sp. CT_GayMR16]TFV88903.1 ketohydroxyglutarate aldolase [Blastococcus sp. CT_GayMR16]
MVELSVTVDDEHAIQEVAAGLRARGMEVAQVLDGIGVITGSAPAGAREALAGVEGVASVDEQLTHQLPPPDAPVQ